MVRKTITITLLLLLAGCAGLPTVEPTPMPPATDTPAPTATANVTYTPLATVGTVAITGDVWLRDAHDVERGYLLQGAEVAAVCNGEWCYVGGLKFYRGCSSDNPAGLACRMR
jgi:hypothetical protein